MKFGKPNLHLARKRNEDSPDEFYLHSVTYFEKSNYTANGHLLPEGLNEQGQYEITLYVIKDSTLPEFGSISPVGHTLNLGKLDFEEEGVILVRVKLQLSSENFAFHSSNGDSPSAEAKGEKETGKDVADTTDADEVARPIPISSH